MSNPRTIAKIKKKALSTVTEITRMLLSLNLLLWNNDCAVLCSVSPKITQCSTANIGKYACWTRERISDALKTELVGTPKIKSLFIYITQLEGNGIPTFEIN